MGKLSWVVSRESLSTNVIKLQKAEQARVHPLTALLKPIIMSGTPVVAGIAAADEYAIDVDAVEAGRAVAAATPGTVALAKNVEHGPIRRHRWKAVVASVLTVLGGAALFL